MVSGAPPALAAIWTARSPKLKARAGEVSVTATWQPITGVAARPKPCPACFRSRSMLNNASVPATCASPPALVVCVCLLQTATAWKIATTPISPIATPTRISTSDRPSARRLGNEDGWPRMSVDVGHQRVAAPRAVARGPPAQRDHDTVEIARRLDVDLLVGRGRARETRCRRAVRRAIEQREHRG